MVRHESEVWSLKKKAEGLFVCGSAAGNGGMSTVRHSRGARGRGQKSKVGNKSYQLSAFSHQQSAESGRAFYKNPPPILPEAACQISAICTLRSAPSLQVQDEMVIRKRIFAGGRIVFRGTFMLQWRKRRYGFQRR